MSNDTSGQQADEILNFLKREAKSLQLAAKAESARAKARLQQHSPAVGLGAPLQRKHALATIAREIGFPNWKAVVDCLGSGNGDFDQFLYPSRCHVFWNIWFADYEEASRVREEHGGYLLPFQNQYMVVDDDYIASLTGKPIAAEWNEIGRDWVRPSSRKAHLKLVETVAKLTLHEVST